MKRTRASICVFLLGQPFGGFDFDACELGGEPGPGEFQERDQPDDQLLEQPEDSRVLAWRVRGSLKFDNLSLQKILVLTKIERGRFSICIQRADVRERANPNRSL